MSAADTPDFDPYYKWLGIPTSEQPPNHYRLLGIELFEEDAEVIMAAADRQMGHVKGFATGPYGAQSQQLLNELSKARICLLNPQLKPVYDQQLAAIRSERLKALTASSEQIQPVAVQPIRPQAEDSDNESLAVSAVAHAPSVHRSRRRKSAIPVIAIALVACVPVMAGLIWLAKKTASPTTAVAVLPKDPTPPLAPAPMVVESPAPKQPPDEEPKDVPHDPLAPSNSRPDTPLEQQAPRAQGEPSMDPSPTTPPPSPSPLEEDSAQPKTPAPSTTPSEPVASENPKSPQPDSPLTGLFGSLPTYASLSGKSDETTAIGPFTPSLDDLTKLTLVLVAPNYLERSSRTIVLHPELESDVATWLVFDEPTPVARSIASTGEVGDAVALGQFQATHKGLSFAWHDTTGREASVERVQNCLLRCVADEHVHHLQLRPAIEDSTPIVLGNWQEVHKHPIAVDTISNLPPASELMLRVAAGEGFPATTTVDGKADRLAVGEQLWLSFSNTDYAGLGAFWEQKGRVLTVNVSPGFRLHAYPNETFVLSVSEVNQVEKRLARDKRDASKEHDRRVRKRGVLQRNLAAANNIDIRLPGGGTTVQARNQKQAAIVAAQSEVNANEARIAALDQTATLINQDEGARLPALRALATSLEGSAKVAFELYLPVGGGEVVLYRKGVISKDEAANVADGSEPLATSPSTVSSVPPVGRFLIKWQEQSGSAGESAYDFRQDGSVWKERSRVGQLLTNGGTVSVHFDDRQRGSVELSDLTANFFTGTHRWADGRTSQWVATRVAGVPAN